MAPGVTLDVAGVRARAAMADSDALAEALLAAVR